MVWEKNSAHPSTMSEEGASRLPDLPLRTALQLEQASVLLRALRQRAHATVPVDPVLLAHAQQALLVAQRFEEMGFVWRASHHVEFPKVSLLTVRGGHPTPPLHWRQERRHVPLCAVVLCCCAVCCNALCGASDTVRCV